jgi:PPOX class probable F420-dependent enzyme
VVGMDIAEALDHVRQHHRAVLATTRQDGSPQLSPVSVAAAADGTLLISSREPAYKVRNLRRRPTASVCVFTDAFYGPWVQVDGDVQIVSLPEAMDLLVDYYRLISGEHPDWDDYRAAMIRDSRCIIRITPRRAGPNRSG